MQTHSVPVAGRLTEMLFPEHRVCLHMIQTHKFLDISNHEVIGTAVYDYVVNHTDILQKPVFWNPTNHSDLLVHVPELQAWIKEQNLTVTRIVIIYMEYPADDITHVDDDQTIRVLWPIKNCEHSYTVFYHIPKQFWFKVFDQPDAGTYYDIKKYSPRKELARIELVQPVVFNPSLPHNVVLSKPLDGPRLSMTIGFDNQDPRSKSISKW